MFHRLRSACELAILLAALAGVVAFARWVHPAAGGDDGRPLPLNHAPGCRHCQLLLEMTERSPEPDWWHRVGGNAPLEVQSYAEELRRTQSTQSESDTSSGSALNGPRRSPQTWRPSQPHDSRANR